MSDATKILQQLAGTNALQAQELAQLPRWALLALATRGAQRVRPLFTSDWKDAPQEHRDALDQVLELASTSASRGATEPELPEAIARAGAVATAAGNLTARFASFTVAFAAINAANTATAENRDSAVAFVQAVADAAHKAGTFAGARVNVLRSATTQAIPEALHRAMRHDFTELLNRVRREGLGEDAPVDPRDVGDLWPEGIPQGFPTG